MGSSGRIGSLERGTSCHSVCPLQAIRLHHLSEGAASREAKGTDELAAYVPGTAPVTLSYLLTSWASVSLPVSVASEGTCLLGSLGGLDGLTFVRSVEWCLAQSVLYSLNKM